MTQRIQFTAGRQGVRALAQRLAGILSGRESDPDGVGVGFLTCLGFGALTDIKDAFITKSHGGTDEMGVKWPPLSKEYLAYGRRFGKGEQAALKKAAGLGAQHRYAPGSRLKTIVNPGHSITEIRTENKGLLTAAQLRRWQEIYGRALARWLLSLPEGEAKARAAQIAWATLKREGAKTKLDVFGNRQVDINHDTGVLFNSLSPGPFHEDGPRTTYQKPSGKGGDEQVFDVTPGRVEVGTNVAYSAAVDKRRQLVPHDESEIPDKWWANWLGIAANALASGAAIIARRAA